MTYWRIMGEGGGRGEGEICQGAGSTSLRERKSHLSRGPQPQALELTPQGPQTNSEQRATQIPAHKILSKIKWQFQATEIGE
jgi:hypothetical protein